MEKKISVIIPCYNVEEYIDRCVMSLLRQTIGLDALELIFVDDASTDGTPERLRHWEQRYPDSVMVILCEENGRQGRARNIGFLYAGAPYIGYVDADDWVEPEMFQTLYDLAERYHTQVTSCLGGRDHGDGNIFYKISYKGEANKLVQIETEQDRKAFLRCGIGPMWTKLFRKDFLEENQISFLEQTAYEDNYFGALTSYAVQSFYLTDRVYYHYFANWDSTITRRNDTKHLERLQVEKKVYDELEKRGYAACYREEMKRRFLKVYYLNSLHLIFTRFDRLPYDVLQEMREQVLKRVPDYRSKEMVQRLNQMEQMFLISLDEEMTEKRWDHLARNYREMTGYTAWQENQHSQNNQHSQENQNSQENMHGQDSPTSRTMQTGKQASLKNPAHVMASVSEILTQTGKTIYYFRRQNYYMALHLSGELIEKMNRIWNELAEWFPQINQDGIVADMEEMLASLLALTEAQQKKDYVLLADLYELQLQPAFTAIQERLAALGGIILRAEMVLKNLQTGYTANRQLMLSLFSEELLHRAVHQGILRNEDLEQLTVRVNETMLKGYAVEITSSGMYTAAVWRGQQKYYLHTNGQIGAEAFALAQEWLAQEKENYCFYGFGFGYPYMELLELDHNISVQVFETNRECLFLAMLFSPVWKLFESGRFSLCYDPTGHRLEHQKLSLTETSGFYVFYPALYAMKKEHLRQQLETWFMEESSVRQQERNLKSNFRKNSAVKAGSIEDLRRYFCGKKAIVAAAGPSLDRNIQMLHKRGDDTVLLVMGTVLGRFLQEGIRPDFVIIVDGGKPTYRQIQGIEHCGVPLIFLSTVYGQIVRDYDAPKYILCQKGFAMAERLAGEKGWATVETGGSVATTALDLCLRLKVSEIVFVGLDMAYTGEYDHASGTAGRKATLARDGVLVEGVDGSMLKAGRNLKIYREWMEKRLAGRTPEERNTRVIDATEGGARKRGMELMTLQEALQG
ncbi:MAG: DUF115 domain-containing protein [Clostridiaceae bacterium]|nr:DUF115 domain-containing protein [Clostridiaceae bacterium]